MEPEKNESKNSVAYKLGGLFAYLIMGCVSSVIIALTIKLIMMLF